MPTLEVIKAWKDEEYRDSLPQEQRAQLPEHPAGAVGALISIGVEESWSGLHYSGKGCCRKTTI